MQTKAKITSKGQITIPSVVRKAMGVKEGDNIAFEPSKNGFNITPIRKGSTFAKYRGIGNPGIGSGRKAVVDFIREMRGHDDFDDE